MTSSVAEQLLDCCSWQHAQDIVDRLFESKLITSAEIVPLKGTNEVRLIISHLESDARSVVKILQEKFETTTVSAANTLG